MARLQDFQTVTPTANDKLLVVQSQGQGLVAYGSKLDSANPTGTGALSLNRASGSTVGTYSTAEGYNCTASGNYGSHAEGSGTVASGICSHAEGSGTIANHAMQHSFGQYNVADPSTAQPSSKGNYIEIVGKGTSEANRSNARTLDWSGNEVLAGDLTINGNTSVGNAIGGIKRYELNSGNPITIATGSYSAFLILGFAQGIGVVNLLVKNVNNTITVYDVLSGNAFSSTYLTFTISSGQLKIESTLSSYSYLTIIGGGLSVSL